MEIPRNLQLLLIPDRTSVSQHAVDHLVGQTYFFGSTIEFHLSERWLSESAWPFR